MGARAWENGLDIVDSEVPTEERKTCEVFVARVSISDKLREKPTILERAHHHTTHLPLPVPCRAKISRPVLDASKSWAWKGVGLTT